MPITISGSTGIAGVDGSASTPAVQGTDTNTGIAFPAADTVAIGTGGTERMRVDSSGNVGIGTSSPAYKLHSSGNIGSGQTGTNGFYGLKRTSDGVEIGSFNTDGTNVVLNTGAALAFQTGGTERARITSGGNFFVNATALPAGTHTVGGTIYTQGFYCNYGIGSHSGVGGAYQANAINFQWNGSAVRLWVDSTDIGSITVSSDYRVKKDIKTQAATALDRVLQIRPVTYTYADYAPFSWKADGVSREGFIAHELAEIIPSAVEGAKDEPNKVQSLKLDALCSVLVKAIQELKAENDDLKARLTALEAK